MKLPALPTLDAADRRIVSIGLVLLLSFVLACMAIGAGVGLGVRAFFWFAGG